MSATPAPNPTLTKGFLLAGAYNIGGVLLFSKVYSNSLLSSLDPTVFSWLGLVAIVLWGVAYASVAWAYQAVPYLVLVFFVEKMLYGVNWITWLARYGETLPSLFEKDALTAIFYATYGAGDILFGLFFLWVGVKSLPKSA